MMLLQNCYYGFSSSLTGETCPLYAAPVNGALACNKAGSDYVCAVMCKNGFDFVSNPPLLYFCSAAQWQTFISFPQYPYSPQLPWPDCSSKLIFIVIYSSVHKHPADSIATADIIKSAPQSGKRKKQNKTKSSTKPITRGRVKPDILESVVGVGNSCPVSLQNFKPTWLHNSNNKAKLPPLSHALWRIL